MSCTKLSQMPADTGNEIAFVGRSNAGKSSTLNLITGRKKLAFTSKTPGRTQQINIFSITAEQRLIDLPGYGYAKVSKSMKLGWHYLINQYLRQRQSLRGLILIVDCRHDLKATDRQVLEWATGRHLPLLLLLNKADKLSRNQQFQQMRNFQQILAKEFDTNSHCQLFSTLSKLGLDSAKQWAEEKLTSHFD